MSNKEDPRIAYGKAPRTWLIRVGTIFSVDLQILSEVG